MMGNRNFYIRALIITAIYLLCVWKWGIYNVTPFLFAYIVLQILITYLITKKSKNKRC